MKRGGCRDRQEGQTQINSQTDRQAWREVEVETDKTDIHK